MVSRNDAEGILRISLQEFTTKRLLSQTEIVALTYSCIAKAVQNLEELGLCRCERDSAGSKSIDFGLARKDLWEKAKPFMASPVKEHFYCTGLPDGSFSASGISALSMYSHLAPDPEQTIAAYAKEWKKEQFENLNTFEGPYIVEFWRYPAIGSKSVDKLSLYLSLQYIVKNLKTV